MRTNEKLRNFLTKQIFNILFVSFIGGLFSINAALSQKIRTGSERTEEYVPYLKDKRVGIVANQTTLIGNKSLVDSLLSLKINITKILCPEHGFRGDLANGDSIKDEVDPKTKLPLISIYTRTNKPTPKDLSDLDILIFDLQDVGLRFYTIVSHLHYVMESCAENNLELLILDRPNPNGFYMDGPILDTAFRSFVGMHPIPVVHGLTIAEYAQMINGEKWLAKGIQCKLKLVLCGNYTHDSLYTLPVKPSPNLPNMTSIYLYPSICLFEGTVLSLGRGTEFPFLVYGHPSFTDLKFSFTPTPRRESSNPPLRGQKCFGVDLRDYNTDIYIKAKKIRLDWLISAYKMFKDKDHFFIDYINTLMGSRNLREQIAKGITEDEIWKTWENDINKFKPVRKKYLLYEDFHD